MPGIQAIVEWMVFDMTGANPRDITLNDSKLMKMVNVNQTDYHTVLTKFVFEAMKIANPQSFDDLVKLCGLMHGTDVWLGNAEILIKEGTANISEVLADRNDVYDAICNYGVDEEIAYKITEDVRKGKVSYGKSEIWNDWKHRLLDKSIPNCRTSLSIGCSW